MSEKPLVVLYYARPNKYSINSLAGALESRGLVDRIGLHFPVTEKHLLEVVNGLGPSHGDTLVCVSFFTTQLQEIRQLVRRLRDAAPKGTLLVAGGPHPTADPEGTLGMGFDMVVVGEGEETFVDMVQRLLEGGDPKGVEGVASLNVDGRVRFTPRKQVVDLNAFSAFSAKNRRFGPIEITRGCPFGCMYCQTPYLHGRRPRHRSVQNTLEAARILVEHGLGDIRFITPNAFGYGSFNGRTVAMDALKGLLRGLREELGGKARVFFGTFPSEVRPEHVTPDTVGLLREYADNDNITIGAQSGSQRMLDIMRRGHTVVDVLNAVRIARGAGLKVNVDLIFGLPGEQKPDVRDTIALMSELQAMGARIHAHTFMPLPQTPWAHARPGELSRELQRALNEMIPKGAVFGQWRQQQQWSSRMAGDGKGDGISPKGPRSRK